MGEGVLVQHARARRLADRGAAVGGQGVEIPGAGASADGNYRDCPDPVCSERSGDVDPFAGGLNSYGEALQKQDLV